MLSYTSTQNPYSQGLGYFFTEVCEESIRDNFVVIYELLDEMMDFGYPQITDPGILKEFVTQKSHKLAARKSADFLKDVTRAISWRKEGIVHSKNEIFVDVIEKVNLMINTSGNVLRSEVVGSVHCKSMLSGMPEIRLGLNDRVQFNRPEDGTSTRGTDGSGGGSSSGNGYGFGSTVNIEDVNFHQCVRLNHFEQERAISFVPPDGEFDLMTYRVETPIRPLFWVEATISVHEHSRFDIVITLKSQFRANSAANDVVVSIPVPADAHTPRYKSTIGKCSYVPDKNTIEWRTKTFPGGAAHVLRAQLALASLSSEDRAITHKPISIKFEIPYFTVSGFQLTYMKVFEKSGYKAIPWIRYITRSGEYQIRT